MLEILKIIQTFIIILLLLSSEYISDNFNNFKKIQVHFFNKNICITLLKCLS